MAKIDQLQYLMDHDPEFKTLYKDAIITTNTLFRNTARDLAIFRLQFSPSWSAEEFFAKYKVILGWSIMMGKILNKIQGEDQNDIKALRPISGTSYGYIMYHDQDPWGPWKITVLLDCQTQAAKIRLSVALKPMSSSKGTKNIPANQLHDHYADIEFILYQPAVVKDLNTDKLVSDLLDSKMFIYLYNNSQNKSIYRENLSVKYFTPKYLEEFFKQAYQLI